MAQQLNFDLPGKPALGRDDFFVAPSNELAVSLVENGGAWTSGKLALTGPKGSGKTHLAHVWAAQTGARIVQATTLIEVDVPDLASGPLVIEDLPQIAQDPERQAAAFHLHNLAMAAGHPLMLTGRPAPSQWALSLPDLQSRAEAALHARLYAPDDMLLTAVLYKLFADRQLSPRPDLVPWLLKRIDRSFDAAADAVDRLDRAALRLHRNLNRRLAMDVLGPDTEPR
jgi:chromosomal replication initiation ATPase DnaA